MTDTAPDPLLAHAERSIAVGSKSFAAAARLFAPSTRRSAMLLYAWCRHCDDVIDGQQAGHAAVALAPHQARQRLLELQAQTDAACRGAEVSEPVFAALREVARQHAIPRQEAFDLLEGFAQDVSGQRYHTLEDTLGYCYPVAGVVGLMMARIMGVRDAAVLDRACDLGLAMQLTNIARDIVDDAKVGRCYLPETWLAELHIPGDALTAAEHRPALAHLARRLVEHAEPYYASAQAGLGALPWRSAWAVATAGLVYRQIGLKVRKAGGQAWDGRLSTSKAEKLVALAGGLWRALTRRLHRYPPRDPRLWQRPRSAGAAAHHGAPATERAGAPPSAHRESRTTHSPADPAPHGASGGPGTDA
ncbi:All-trans-phytoene synthase/15-cis-phytoene synthase [Pseudomonas reidholzensis]|uniref:All-trans-phytoene synthase/15-cis-phytoene synthase n=1 Tax=Pseudomonas reidholzensis TaxID=1785162 RepID=A0A383RUF0_9PSED|nr:All-trans-phytoene synthase/15-cis-phytoene synthase [Pseudomonas reidholzensis]